MGHYLISNPETQQRLDALEARLEAQLWNNRDRGINAHANFEDICTQQIRKDIARAWAVIEMNCPYFETKE